jgi:DNA-binding MarR family transcriptional regulator
LIKAKRQVVGTSAVQEEMINQVVGMMQRAYMELRPVASQEWLGLDLTIAQLKVLIFLRVEGRTRMGALASALGVTMPTATSVMDRLVERGLVVREADPNDRRVVVCRLSQAGMDITEQLWRLKQERLRSVLQRMTVPQLRLVAQAMEAILEIASPEARQAPPLQGSAEP